MSLVWTFSDYNGLSYSGPLLEFLPASRSARLLNDISVDLCGYKWEARAGLITDGSSIPAELWGRCMGYPMSGPLWPLCLCHDQDWWDSAVMERDNQDYKAANELRYQSNLRLARGLTLDGHPYLAQFVMDGVEIGRAQQRGPD
jgi:hypothetical protein